MKLDLWQIREIAFDHLKGRVRLDGVAARGRLDHARPLRAWGRSGDMAACSDQEMFVFGASPVPEPDAVLYPDKASLVGEAPPLHYIKCIG
jgi:hypothetical protein